MGAEVDVETASRTGVGYAVAVAATRVDTGFDTAVAFRVDIDFDNAVAFRVGIGVDIAGVVFRTDTGLETDGVGLETDTGLEEVSTVVGLEEVSIDFDSSDAHESECVEASNADCVAGGNLGLA